jgi:uncharacterized protein YajQ (UPF0234 family)
MHNYTENMHIPDYILKAMGTLNIAYPFTEKELTRQYHKMVKKTHPDTKNTIQDSQVVLNNRQINDLQASYNTLKNWLK